MESCLILNSRRFYNTTYIIFAASIILVYTNQEASESEIQPLLKLVGMAIEVLETMADECVVAGKSAKLLQKALETDKTWRQDKASGKVAATLMSMTGTTAAAPAAPAPDSGSRAEISGVAPDALFGTDWRHGWAPVSFLENDMMGFDFGMPFMDFESSRDELPGP